RRADRRCIADATVSADAVQHRVSAVRIEARRNARELEGRAQEGLAEAASLGRVIARFALRVDIPHGTVFAALVDELDGEERAIAQVLAVLRELFEGDDEAIATAYVEHEVDVPCKHVRDCDG